MASPRKSRSKTQAFWTIKDIAEHLDVSERSVHRWIDTGDLVVCRFGRLVRVADSDFRSFLAQHRDV